MPERKISERRVLRFRAWRRAEMIYLSGFVFGGPGWATGDRDRQFIKIFWGEGNFEVLLSDEVVIMAFSGLYDARGRDVYEGDKLNCSGSEAQVVFYDGAFCVDISGRLIELCRYLESFRDAVVCGNVMEEA